jgi:hypothetical protein
VDQRSLRERFKGFGNIAHASPRPAPRRYQLSGRLDFRIWKQSFATAARVRSTLGLMLCSKCSFSNTRLKTAVGAVQKASSSLRAGTSELM